MTIADNSQEFPAMGGVSLASGAGDDRTEAFASEKELQVSAHASPADMQATNAGKAGARMRVMLIASAGGHWIELCRLVPAFAECDCRFVSTAPGLTVPMGQHDVLEVIDSSRDSMWTMVRTFAHLLPIIRDFRPDILVSTGAAPGALGLVIAKLCGARTIWVDSIANSETLSLSGSLVKLFTDLRLTQWPHLADERKKLHYFGKIL